MILSKLCMVTIFVAATVYAADTVEHDAFESMLSQPQESWYNLSLMNTKLGYMHTYVEKAEYQGEVMLRNRTDMLLSFKALGKDTTLEMTYVEYTDSRLMPRHFRSTSNTPGLKQVEGHILDNVAYIKTILNGETTESEIPLPPNTISGLVGAQLLLSQKQLEIGDRKTFNLFSYDLLLPIKAELHVVAEETITYQSEEKQVYTIDQTLDMMDGITTRMWISRDGEVTYRTETPLMGLSLIATKTDKESALGDIGEIDVILRTRILATGKRPSPKAAHLVAAVSLTKGNVADAIMSNSRQKLHLTSEQAGTVSIQIPTVDVESCPDLPIQNSELDPYLSATAYIQAEHPTILAKALEILEVEVNSWRASKKLCEWVYAAILDKEINGGFASSLTALETGSGDCTEHTVLFIALARAVGIPARICSGLVFSRNAFYYHFWPEVYVGRWVQMDPTLGQVRADATHIQLGGSTLESDTLTEFATEVLRTLNQLEIVVVD